MPFIKVKVSCLVSPEQEFDLKAAMGKAMNLFRGRAKNICFWNLKTLAISGCAEKMMNRSHTLKPQYLEMNRTADMMPSQQR